MRQKIALSCASLTVLLLAGCTTTPDQSYKQSQMTKALDYPPDLVAPTLSPRFSVPPEPPTEEDEDLDND